MAPWNLHEREIVSIDGDEILLNDQSKLVFYHFSKLADNDQAISREYDRYDFNDFPMLKNLYEGYREAINKSNFLDYKNLTIAYDIKALGAPKPVKGSILNRFLKKISLGFSYLASKV